MLASLIGQPKKFQVNDFPDIHFADICCIQESKLRDVSQTTWRSFYGSPLDQYYFTPSQEALGGMIFYWNNLLIKGRISMWIIIAFQWNF